MPIQTVSQAFTNEGLGAFSFRNRLINGTFEIAQRSAGPVTGSDYTTVDRWGFPSADETSERVANDRDLSIPFALKVTATAAGYGQVFQRIEDVRTDSGKQITLSFWAKSPNTGAMRLAIYQNFGSGGSTFVSVIDNETYFNITQANTWQFFTATVTMPSVSGKTIGAGNHIQIGIGPNSGTANRVVTYSEVQWEVGSVATPFERRPYGIELQLCYRYYQALNSENYLSAGFSAGGAPYSTAIPFLARTRAVPSVTLPTAGQSAGTISFTASNGGYPGTTGTHNIYSVTTKDFALSGSGYSGLTGGTGAYLYSNGSVTYQINAEL